MPEQQSFVLYIVVGSGSKSGSRLPKTAPGAVFKVRLHGSLATGQKTAPGFQRNCIVFKDGRYSAQYHGNVTTRNHPTITILH